MHGVIDMAQTHFHGLLMWLSTVSFICQHDEWGLLEGGGLLEDGGLLDDGGLIKERYFEFLLEETDFDRRYILLEERYLLEDSDFLEEGVLYEEIYMVEESDLLEKGGDGGFLRE